MEFICFTVCKYKNLIERIAILTIKDNQMDAKQLNKIEKTEEDKNDAYKCEGCETELKACCQEWLEGFEIESYEGDLSFCEVCGTEHNGCCIETVTGYDEYDLIFSIKRNLK